MTRKSRREIERALDKLTRDLPDTSSVDARESVIVDWVTYDSDDIPDGVVTAYEVVNGDGDPVKNLYRHMDGSWTERLIDE